MFVDPSNLESHEDSRHPRRAGQTDPALLTTLKHAASMPNSLFYERKCRRTSTRSMPPASCKLRREPRRRADPALRAARYGSHAGRPSRRQARGHHDRAQGTAQEFTFHATLTGDQKETVAALARYDLGTLVVPPGADAVRFSIVQRLLPQLACPPARQHLSLRQSPACRRSR